MGSIGSKSWDLAREAWAASLKVESSASISKKLADAPPAPIPPPPAPPPAVSTPSPSRPSPSRAGKLAALLAAGLLLLGVVFVVMTALWLLLVAPALHAVLHL